MVAPIIIGIAAALGLGLGEVTAALAPKPAEEALKRLVNRKLDQIESDEDLLTAVEQAFADIGADCEPEGFVRYALNLGFDQMQAKDNPELRRDMARAVLLMTEDDPALIPRELVSRLRWPSDRLPVLATFLRKTRFYLSEHPVYGALIQYANDERNREHIRNISEDAARIARYWRVLLLDRNIDPDKNDVQALKEYLAHVIESCSALSFLFIKPSGRPGQVCTEAELETVFVPLEVQDPEAEERMRRKQARMGFRDFAREEMETDAEQDKPVTVKEVLAKYRVFLLKGKPGSGKTTLLRHMALAFARGEAADRLDWTGDPLLPILVPLRNFGRFLADNRKEYTNPAPLALRKFIEDYFAEHDLLLPPDFFHRRLNAGKCLVLLDGLDEVADRDLRATVAQMVNAFINHYKKTGNRFGLASRPRGYEEVADYLPQPVVCVVQPLTPEGRDELVTRLLRVLEPDTPHRLGEPHPLIADIRAKDKVDDLSRTPLFCTTLVLVYKYRGTALPERRVDIYKEIVDLMLGFWETHKAEQGVADVQELVRMDGTGRAFMDEREAVEAKRRALTDVADWMQRENKSSVERDAVAKHLAQFFHEREGASDAEKGTWAENFLAIAHQRSGLFVESEPETYAFSHASFREYLAATALIEQLDTDMVQTVLDHATDSWWHEVILLGAAHPNLSDKRREMLLGEMLRAGHVTLAGRCAVDAGARLPAPLRAQIRDALHARMIDAAIDPKDRYAAGEALDELGWLPQDLHAWVRCKGCAEGGGDLMVMRYPVTNAQYERFILAGGYEDSRWWTREGWRWRETAHPDYRGAGPVREPRYWQAPRFGRKRRGYPVVGVSWYEAAAYAKWLSDVLARARKGDKTLPDADRELVAGLVEVGGREVRLPFEEEWEKAAGGAGASRFPWDPPKGPASRDERDIKARANTVESGIGGTSPVAMYPLGASQPFGLMDLAGNVWEWTATGVEGWHGLRGGSWNNLQVSARCEFRNRYYPNYSYDYFGFRLVSPVGSGF
ncbi:MAG: SUMF1/EgtB/PvdO family nonheme iron enzyme [Chloroflexi bacterium]|nr:SUMF1/EgtB/PvdO family nonheme iron enzyme [Chloroflexota bacterium]